LKFETLWDASASKASSLNLTNDYRKRYLQVADSSTLDATYNSSLSPKLTPQSIRSLLRRKLLQLKRWRGNNLDGLTLKNVPSFKLYNYSFNNTLFEFYKTGGLVVIPFELGFYDSASGIEKKLALEYPDLISEYPRVLGLEEMKQLHEMKTKLLNGLSPSDFNSILSHFYFKNYFRPEKKIRKYTWYDIRQIDLKMRNVGTTLTPVVTVKGNLYFWSELWLRSYLRSAEIKKVVRFGSVTYTIFPRYIPPYFLFSTNHAIITRWITKELSRLIVSGYNTLSNFVRSDLGLNENTILSVSTRPLGLKDYEITVNKVWNPGNYLVNNGEVIKVNSLAIKKRNKRRTTKKF
jgi:hypothetical protein